MSDSTNALASPPSPPATSTAVPRHGGLGGWRRLMILACVVAAAAIAVTYAVWTWSDLRRRPVRPLEMGGQWVRAAGEPAYTGCFVRRVRLPGHARNAWLAIAACDGFEVTVNGTPVGWQYLWRPTRPFQATLSEPGQRLTWPLAALSLNFARDYQWESHRNYVLPVFFDLAPYLTVGTNRICVEVESRRAPAKVRLDGDIELCTGERISLASSPDWQGEAVPPDYQHLDWRSPQYEAAGWPQAVVAETPPGQLLRTFDPRIYTTPFRGLWIRHPAATAQDSTWFEKQWHCDQVPDEAWLRIAANRNYEVCVNGRRWFLKTPDTTGLESGEWIFGNRRAADAPAAAERLDPHDAEGPFLPETVEPSWHGRPVDREWWEETPLATRRTTGGPSVLNQPVVPKALARDLAIGGFYAYNLSGLLHAGSNTIAIRLDRPATSDPARWPGQLAVDGEISSEDGSRDAIVSDGTWTARPVGADPVAGPSAAARVVRSARQAEGSLPTLHYRGTPLLRDFFPPWLKPAILAALAALLGAAGGLTLVGLFVRRRAPGAGAAALSRPVAAFVSVVLDALLPLGAVIAAMILLYVAYGERREQVWFLQPDLWFWGLGAAALLGGLAALARILRLTGASFPRLMAGGWQRFLHRFPQTYGWSCLILGIALSAFFLRVYALDFQPLDDDELASAQAIASIAQTGVPKYVPDAVWYTRSPLYHYLVGGAVWLFGENLWVLRLPSALFGVATGLLLYWCGARLLHRPWVGLTAFLLAAVHPEMIFTSHLVRFYQQQQFFALLTICWFCKGFVTDQSQRYRYLTLAAFAAAVLSQEVSFMMAFPLAVGYLFFAANRPTADNVKLIVAAACVVVAIAVDWLVFQTHCLTRFEGYSPTMQADIQPHFWEPYNFLSLFLGYSRIHVLLSIALLLGMPAAFRERDRVVYALHLFLFSGVVLTNLLVTQVSLRYQYWLYPLLLLLAVNNARAGLARWGALLENRTRRRPRLSFASGAALVVVCLAMVLSWSPWKIAATYDTKLLGDSTGAFSYIRSQLRPDDIVMTTEPHAKGALLEIGRSDYEIQIPVLYDFVLLQRGALIDRAAAARAVTSLEQLQQLCGEHPRIWIAINRERFLSRGQAINWQYPAARVELFLRQNLQLKYRSHLWCVYLWDADQGFQRSFRHDS